MMVENMQTSHFLQEVEVCFVIKLCIRDNGTRAILLTITLHHVLYGELNITRRTEWELFKLGENAGF